MKRLAPIVAAALLSSSSALAHPWVGPSVVTPGWFPPSLPYPNIIAPLPPIVIAPPPVIVAPPPVVVAPPPPPVYAPPPPPPPPICVVNLPPWEWLNLRVSPNGPIIFAMRPGTPLALFNVAGSWGFVQTPRGVTGWAFLPYTICH